MHRAEEVPVLLIGTGDGPDQELFSVIHRVWWAADSVVGVLDSQINVVRMYDLSGQLLLELGGTGEGPGEMIAPMDSWVDEDGGLGVIDPALRRVTRYAMVGGFEILDFPSDPVASDGAVRHLGRVGGDWVAFTSELAPYPGRGERLESSVRLWAIGPGGATSGRAELPSLPWYTTEAGRSVRLPSALHPFPRAVLNRGVGAVLDPGHARILIYGGSGEWSEVPLPDRCLAVPVEYFEESTTGNDIRAQIPLPEFRALAPECMPGYDQLAVTGDGSVWVRLTRERGEAAQVARWLLVDVATGPMHVVLLPARFTPMDKSGEVVVGRWLDSLDVHHVKGLRLPRFD